MVKIYRKDLDGFYDVSPDRAAELVEGAGYSYSPVEQEISSPSKPAGPSFDTALATARALFGFMPEEVINEYAKQWIKYDDTELAIAQTRQSDAWNKNFSYLKRDDGSLIMSEAESLSVKASYTETLREVGITDAEPFDSKFNDLISGEVSAAEFQQRVDLVYNQVVNQIPEVERLYRERYNIDVDQPTIFGALIDDEISD